jgi:hypothetical protein
MKSKQLWKRKKVLKESELSRKLLRIWAETKENHSEFTPQEWKIERRRLRMKEIQEAREVRREMLKNTSPVK